MSHFGLSKPYLWRLCRAGACLLVACAAIAIILLFFSPKPPLLDDVNFGGMVLDSKGKLLKLGLASDEKYRIRIKLDDVAPEAIHSLIRYEDKHFYQHPGVNPLSMLRALVLNAGRAKCPGASTITMQVARLRYNLKTSSLSGKLIQIWNALVLERHYSKQDILEAYFNLAPYGGNIEGIEAAARIYFNKSAYQLTDSEAHALTVVPQNPGARNPAFGVEFNKARFMFEHIIGSPGGESEFIGAPLKVYKPADLPFYAPHVSLELLRASVTSKINTGIERELQVLLEKSLHNYTDRGKRFGIENAAAILVDTRTMNIAALAGSADFFNNSISGQIDGSNVRRSPGSTLKPFIYALAIDQGIIHPMTILLDSPRSWGVYDPENFDKNFRGPLPAHEALKASRNLPAIFLTEQLAYPGLYGFLKKAGINLSHGPEYYGLALALGGAEVSMRELASLYAMLANRGLWQPLLLDRNKKFLKPQRMLSPESAWLAIWMLDSQETYISSRGKQIPLYFKTGTSNGLRDAWTAGIVGHYVLVIWIGNFDNSSNPYFVGAKTALPLFQEIAHALGAIRNLNDILEHNKGLNLEDANFCISTGDFDNGHCGTLAVAKYIPGVSPIRDSGIFRPILVDKKTGKRACEQVFGETEEVWWEFWPTEMRNIFAKAGINKPGVPDWLPGCKNVKQIVSHAGKMPRIILPKKNVIYKRRLNNNDFKLALQASADSDAGIIHWYADSAYIGKTLPGEILFWKPDRGGKIEIFAVDNAGRSGKQLCKIETLP